VAAFERSAQRQTLEECEETAHIAFAFFTIADNARSWRMSSVHVLRLPADEQMCSF
jgi:hypothetical protein